MTDLYSAILRPSGPNFEYWNQILGSHRVPLESAQSKLAQLGEEKSVEVYMLNLKALTLRQRAKLLTHIAQRFKVPISDVEREIAERGFPIRAEDVIVSFSTKAFV